MIFAWKRGAFPVFLAFTLLAPSRKSLWDLPPDPASELVRVRAHQAAPRPGGFLSMVCSRYVVDRSEDLRQPGAAVLNGRSRRSRAPDEHREEHRARCARDVVGRKRVQ